MFLYGMTAFVHFVSVQLIVSIFIYVDQQPFYERCTF